jgi:hypothetical protein
VGLAAGEDALVEIRSTQHREPLLPLSLLIHFHDILKDHAIGHSDDYITYIVILILI